LLADCLDDYVTEDNAVRVVDAFIDELDLAALGFAGVVPEATGRPSYHPVTLLKIYLYAYLNQVQSSRRLADRLTIVPPEISNRLEVGRELPGQPHQLDVALRFPFGGKRPFPSCQHDSACPVPGISPRCLNGRPSTSTGSVRFFIFLEASAAA
jgi:hypothetical protein